MKEVLKPHKPLLVIITFRSMLQKEVSYLRLIHSLIVPIFSGLEKRYKVQYLKLKEKAVTIPDCSENEIYFNVKAGFLRFFPLSLFFFLRKHKPSIVFVHGFIFPLQLLFLYCFISGSTKVIVQHHAEKPYQNRIKRWFQKIAYSRADAYLFTSKGLAQIFVEDKIIRDSNLIHEVMEFSSRFINRNMNRPAHSFLWIGRLDANKDPITMLKGFRLYLYHNPKAKLNMIYASAIIEDEVKLYIKENEMSAAVKLLGKIPHDRLEVLFNSSVFFISASHYEGMGIAFCEAMSCGCIPIGTNIAPFRSMTDDRACALLFEPGNEVDLFNKLKESERIDIEKMRELVLLQFKNKLSFNAIGRRIEEVADRLVNS
ncbi:glycosyltransferase family 4 protein [uncultured Arcticibacterium sp.]|uniref:glycosyltransferase family 4 protein n=1 Tax=uncultured Arcticibacterium sp. TaxID=2173042 RepID=UPI0030F86725